EKLEANPEWEKMLEHSGIADGLRRMGELQQDGADIFMSTFSHMKNYAFFNDVVNWFIPYNPEHSQVVYTEGGQDGMAQVVDRLAYLCDNDKYSMVLSAYMVPKAQRDFIINQLNQNTEQIAEAVDPNEANMSERDVAVRRATRSFLQNYYRFVKLYRRKGEFADPYREGLNLLTVPALAPYIHDETMVSLLGEYYFKYEYWEDALTAFRSLEDADDAPEATLYQKIGYCHEQLGDMSAALSAYEYAELLDDNSRWLLRRLAYTNRRIGRDGQALTYYKRLSEAAPDDTSATLALAYAYIRLTRWAKALNLLRKVEFADPEDTRLWRPLAWVLFAQGDYESARKYWQRINAESLTTEDHLNIGHLEAATGNIREALTQYRLAQQDGDTEALIRRLEADGDILRRAGITPVKMTLIEEALRNGR
ncbi:MAG TPA: tetratricopeptide repeat protein, partial [Muribaculaceae bacterium]|nr:tetratricopeptide repeat protein [Muribaculaceae bacterium]